MKTERHGYKFTNKNNTKGGIIATILASVSLIMLIAGIVVSFMNEGNAGLIVGAFGIGAFIFTTVGLIIGLRSFYEKDKFYIFSWIGTISNAVLWIAMCCIIAKGFMNC